MDTPIVKLTDDELNNVYEPSEDSFLLIDALEMDIEILKSQKCTMGLEIGIGSGVVVTALAMALQKACSTYFLGIDINGQACRVTNKTSSVNKVNVETVQMDLLNGIDHRELFDIIVFNPPYVVTESLEIQDTRLISKTWAGGFKGRQVMDRLFPEVPKILSKNGFFYLLVIKENDPDEIIKVFKNLNMIGVVKAERKIRGEHLYVLRFQKDKSK